MSAALLTAAESIETHARLQPDRVGARDSRRSLTYAQWNDRARALARGLLASGLRPGDRVALLAYNGLEWMELYVGLAAAGLVAVPINFRLTTPEIDYIVEHSQARGVVVQRDLQDRVQPLRRTRDAQVVAWVAYGEAPVASPQDGMDAGHATDWIDYEALIAHAPAGQALPQVRPADACALMYTSGTTGRPKGAIRSHQGNTLIALATALEMGFGRDDTALLVMPMCHANSLYFAHTFLHLGATCVIDDRRSFDPAAMLATLSRERITFTSLVPTHYIMMLALPPEVKAQHDVATVAKLLISSAPARRDTKLEILGFFRNARLYELYGSTEAGWVTLLRPHEQLDRLGTVGREWVGSGPIRLLDEHGREVPDGEVGELHSRTPYVFDGYWRNPEKTAESFRDGWCSVGDMARRDADGYITLVDRKSNMIITGGENVYPSEVEGILGGHPAVRDVAVVGVPDAKWGEAVEAVVVLHAGHTVAEAELLDWCRPRMAGYKRPRRIVFCEDREMPRTATGKILHRVLRDRLAATGPDGSAITSASSASTPSNAPAAVRPAAASVPG